MTYDASHAFIGLCLREPKNFERALARGLTLDCFSHEEHAQVFVAMLDAEKSGAGTDAASLAMARPKLAETLMRIRANAPVVQAAEAYVDELLVERWRGVAMATLAEISGELVRRKPFESVDGIKGRAADLLNHLLSNPGAASIGPKKLGDVLDNELKRIELDHETGQGEGIPTGIRVIDKLTSGGMKRGSVNVFAARTGVGKTTLALNIAHHVASLGKGVCYFTVEMPAGQLARKLLSLVGQVKGTRVMTGQLTPPEFDQLWAAHRSLYASPFWIDDTFRASFESFELACRRLKRQGALDLVVIDYVQQLTVAGRFQSKQQELTEVSQRVKQLALELNIAVLSLAQFNREAERQEGEPSLWQIKDSGAIEQDADLGVCLFREGETYWLKVDKNRWGKDRMKFPVEADLSLNVFRDAALNMDGI